MWASETLRLWPPAIVLLDRLLGHSAWRSVLVHWLGRFLSVFVSVLAASSCAAEVWETLVIAMGIAAFGVSIVGFAVGDRRRMHMARDGDSDC